MKRLHLALLVGMGITISFSTLAGNSWGQAVSVDAGSLIGRLDSLEARLGAMESRRSSASSAASGGILAERPDTVRPTWKTG